MVKQFATVRRTAVLIATLQQTTSNRILNQNNPAHILPHYCSKICFNITLPATHKPDKRLAISPTYFPTRTLYFVQPLTLLDPITVTISDDQSTI